MDEAPLTYRENEGQEGEGEEEEEEEEEEEQIAPPGSLPPFVPDRQRAVRIIQPQNEKGAVYSNPHIKYIVLVEENNTFWEIIHRGSFYFLTAFDSQTGLLSPFSPYKFEEMPVQLSYSSPNIYFSDIRRGLRQANTTQTGKKLDVSYVKNSDKQYLETTYFTFSKDGNRLYAIREPVDHKSFRCYGYHKEEDYWIQDFSTDPHEARISILLSDVGPDRHLWIGTLDGTLTVWNEGNLVKTFDAQKRKKGLLSVYSDGEYVYIGGNDKRVSKFTLEGEFVKRLYVRQKVYCVAAVKGLWLLGLQDGDIMVRNSEGFHLGTLRTLSKGSVWDGEDTKDGEKNKRARGHPRAIIVANDGNTVFTVQPKYKCVQEWDFSDYNLVAYSGSRDLITIQQGIQAKTEPIMKDGCTVM